MDASDRWNEESAAHRGGNAAAARLFPVCCHEPGKCDRGGGGGGKGDPLNTNILLIRCKYEESKLLGCIVAALLVCTAKRFPLCP